MDIHTNFSYFWKALTQKDWVIKVVVKIHVFIHVFNQWANPYLGTTIVRPGTV